MAGEDPPGLPEDLFEIEPAEPYPAPAGGAGVLMPMFDGKPEEEDGKTAAPAAKSATTTRASATARTDTTRHRWRTLATLSALMGFASISTDFYLPAIPAMGRTLGAEPGTVELTISGYLIGFSLGQLVWGPISDRYGRRLPVAIGLVLFVVGSAGCALSGSAWAMIGWRILQAVGASAGVVLSRAMVRDLYQGNRAAQIHQTYCFPSPLMMISARGSLSPSSANGSLEWSSASASSNAWP